MKRVPVDVFRSTFRDVETILNLRETCRFFAFHVFPKKWLDVQKCSTIQRISSLLLPQKDGPMTVRKWIELTFRGLRKDQNRFVFVVLYHNRALVKQIIQSHINLHGFFQRHWRDYVGRECISFGFMVNMSREYCIDAKGKVHGFSNPTTLYDMIENWKQQYPKMREAQLL